VRERGDRANTEGLATHTTTYVTEVVWVKYSCASLGEENNFSATKDIFILHT